MQRIFLIGLSGAGKSTIGRQVAELLGWDFVDTDELLAEQHKLPVGQLLIVYGEERFRQLESESLRAVATHERIVIATGGGVVVSEANRKYMRERGLVVYLRVAIGSAWQRIQEQIQQRGDAALRPLLSGDNAQQCLADLYSARRQWYEQAAVHIDTDKDEPAILARRVVAFALAAGCLSSSSETPEVVTLKSTTASSQAIVAYSGLHRLPDALHSCGFPRRVFIVTDSEVGRLYSEPAKALLAQGGFTAHIFTIPAGEVSKSFQSWQQILDWLVERHAERQEPVLALGGGVVGDLAGFAAACYHRGIPLVQIPTSLLAQVDAAIGGKTGINHPQGKNLVGTYYQPRLIIVDPSMLLTLPERVYREGWAEIVKYGMICDADLFELLEAHVPSLLERDGALLARVITRCIRLKMDIVGCDERDSGQRNLLNYGHTFGHALEALTDYTTWLHGEAVAVGMEVAARIAVARGLLSEQEALRQRQLLRALGLPVQYAGLDSAALLGAMQRDKKVRNGCMRWILPTRIGHAELYEDIPLEIVQNAIEASHQSEG
jgi:shikimate kinase/3-dehydroquinate synthase